MAETWVRVLPRYWHRRMPRRSLNVFRAHNGTWHWFLGGDPIANDGICRSLNAAKKRAEEAYRVRYS